MKCDALFFSHCGAFISRKTTLISALTLDAFYGKPFGSVTLNGVPLTDRIFKRYCYGKMFSAAEDL